ncbi:superinfection immunity protein [Burkholderia ambifaria]|uniref:superinfection immunity protein n=1 Tax=Burkholderia ambifaria TaxID=152480 RepID=UPI0013DEC3C7|nr:superinfection immunity protein [Burkholderia ambifaria]
MRTFNLLPARHRRLACAVALAVLSCGYLLPTAVMLYRRRMNRFDRAALFVLNLGSGWTGIGWLASLGIALWTDDGPQPPAHSPEEAVCPRCACRPAPAASRAARRAPARVSEPRPVSRPARLVARLLEERPREREPAARLRYVRVPQQPVSRELVMAARHAREVESWEAQKARLEAEAADAGLTLRLSRLELLVLLDLGPTERAQYWRQRRLLA